MNAPCLSISMIMLRFTSNVELFRLALSWHVSRAMFESVWIYSVPVLSDSSFTTCRKMSSKLFLPSFSVLTTCSIVLMSSFCVSPLYMSFSEARWLFSHSICTATVFRPSEFCACMCSRLHSAELYLLKGKR